MSNVPGAMRFLCISDVHGDADALAQVLAAARDHGYDQLVVAGDLLFPGPKPMETWKLLLEHHALCVQGLSDKALAIVNPAELHASTPEEEVRLERLFACHEALGELILARLAKLPTVARLPLENGMELIVVHGSPSDPTEELSIDMDDDELNARIGDDPADIVICGGSHFPFDRLLPDVRVINVGCVGERPVAGVANATIVETLPMAVSVYQFDVELV